MGNIASNSANNSKRIMYLVTVRTKGKVETSINMTIYLLVVYVAILLQDFLLASAVVECPSSGGMPQESSIHSADSSGSHE